jgi:protein-S-isoprenylcysteine O-methyltransferase Ste14
LAAANLLDAMHTLRTAIAITWLVFWVFWLASAATAKQGSRRGPIGRSPGLLLAIVALVLFRTFRTGTLEVHAVALGVAGSVLLLAGLGLAVWARFHLGRNWGMPMTRKDEPELVTSGPYRFIRHPIYSGMLLALLGTAIATNLYWLVALAIMGVYFIYSARTEERLMADAFPQAYADYKARSKMLIPFVL